ncbi:class I mannose-6-phosphate isomerase [Naasia sp. SYSU D00948]|uniref:class I mannose-6-phosphate isomerase n=1 Tax=Naasia sp. SYSU D00948 TaxID=2817379 RepID=UPI001B310F70|nr:class I mannose-6-phosphate isomerase [Naasia sp. SYSU D00948]
MTTSLAPIPLGPNQPDRPYRGGAGIATFRGTPRPSEYSPEDFVGSTTEIFAGGGIGLSRLPSGVLLRDAVEADPEGWLGRDHVERFGAGTELLVKLLDTAERLFVHLHPDDAFARQHLSLGHGKTEAWIVVAVRPDGDPGWARLGFTRDVSDDEVRSWVRGQRVQEMLDAMHLVPLEPGGTLLVPAGMPHAIGPGVTLVELQEPSDLSVLMEYEGYRGLTADDAFLGLEPDVALGALDRRATPPERILELTGGRASAGNDRGITPLFPEEADRFFRAERIESEQRIELDPGFSILVVLDGTAILGWHGGSLPLSRGTTLLVPFGAGPLAVTGRISALRCRPPRPLASGFVVQ